MLKNRFAALPSCGATSVKPDGGLDGLDLAEEGRMPLNLWCRQCWSRRAVSGESG
jgi:hypothetical protein